MKGVRQLEKENALFFMIFIPISIFILSLQDP